MRMQRREAILCAIATLSALSAAIRIGTAGDMEARAPQVMAPPIPSIVVASDDSLGEAAANAAANDPFRLINQPSSVRFDARNEGGAGGPSTPPTPPRPQFVLKAIVGGPPWQALVDGIPGQPPGTIVRSGDTFDKLSVRRVGRDTVVIQAPDTTWKLTLKRDGQ